jgi:predicted AAA+ superfamily ATPase
VKFVVTGSSSFSLRKGAQNPLTGRVNVFFIPPFAFFDFVRFRLKSKQDEFSSKLIPLANEFQKLLLSGGDGEALLDVVKQSSEIYREFRLEKILEQYLLIGGFPKVVAGDESADMGKYLRDLLTTTIAQDISSTIRDTQAFERLMVNLALQIGSPITYKSLGDKLGIDSRVARSYLDYYIETHWACLSSPFVFHKKADSVGTDKKVYIIDSGVINTLTFKDENDVAEDTEYRGHLVENVIHNHLYYLKQQSGIFQNYIPFWIDPESRREIDFILEAKKSNIPIEVKTMDSISDPKLEAIKRFVEEKKTAHFGIVTTETRLEISEDVIFMPYSLFLLLL